MSKVRSKLKSTKSYLLSAGSWGLGAGATHGAEFDVKGGDAEFLGALGDVLGGQHRGVGGGLVTVSLHLHTAGHTHQSFLKELQSN